MIARVATTVTRIFTYERLRNFWHRCYVQLRQLFFVFVAEILCRIGMDPGTRCPSTRRVPDQFSTTRYPTFQNRACPYPPDTRPNTRRVCLPRREGKNHPKTGKKAKKKHKNFLTPYFNIKFPDPPSFKHFGE